MTDINVTMTPVIVQVSENTYTIDMSSVGAQGATGSAGQINSVSATTLAAGSSATVVNNGSTTNAQLVFGIPRGNTGSSSAATATAGTTTTGAAGTNATVTNSGTTSAAVFDFVIPRGNTGATGQGFTYRNAWVSGTSYIAYDVVTYSGSTYVCILAVSGTTVPSSDTTHWTLTASKGDTGSATTITAGTTTTGAAGTNASVTNSGSSSAAVFDFTIPRGNTGATGQGYTARGLWSSATTYAAYDVVYYNGSTYYALQSGTNQPPSTRPTYWSLTALGINTPVTYNASDTYNPADTVTRLGSTYYNIAQSTGIAPPNATYWQLLASKGDTGATGPTGATSSFNYPIASGATDVPAKTFAGSPRSLSSSVLYCVAFVPTSDMTVSTVTLGTTTAAAPNSGTNKFQVGIFTGNTTTPSTLTCLAYSRWQYTSAGTVPAAFATINATQQFKLGYVASAASGVLTPTADGSATSVTMTAGNTYWIGVSAYSSAATPFATGASVMGFANGNPIFDPWTVTYGTIGSADLSAGSTVSTVANPNLSGYPFFRMT